MMKMNHHGPHGPPGPPGPGSMGLFKFGLDFSEPATGMGMDSSHFDGEGHGGKRPFFAGIAGKKLLDLELQDF